MNDRERLNDVQCILADDLKELIAEYFEKMYPSANHLLAMQFAFYLADHGVTIQKHGRWIDTEVELEPEQGFVKIGETEQRTVCSECSYYTSGRRRRKTKFCPNCSAKMDKEKDHD